MLGLNIRRAELAGFIPRKKDDAPGFLRVAFKHKPIPPKVSAEKGFPPNPDPTTNYAFISPKLRCDIRPGVT